MKIQLDVMVVWVPVGVTAHERVLTIVLHSVLTIVMNRVATGVVVVLLVAQQNVMECVLMIVLAVKVNAGSHVLVLVRMDVTICVALLVSQNVCRW